MCTCIPNRKHNNHNNQNENIIQHNSRPTTITQTLIHRQAHTTTHITYMHHTHTQHTHHHIHTHTPHPHTTTHPHTPSNKDIHTHTCNRCRWSRRSWAGSGHTSPHQHQAYNDTSPGRHTADSQNLVQTQGDEADEINWEIRQRQRLKRQGSRLQDTNLVTNG